MPGLMALGQARASFSLQEAYTALEERYPALQNAGVLESIYQTELAQLDIALLPSLTLHADGRLQSESTQLESSEMSLPIEIDQPLVSVRAYAEARYNILDGGSNEAQRRLKKAQLQSGLQGIEVERFALRERINQLFINIETLRQQAGVFDLSLQDLQARKEQVAAAVAYGSLLESELTKIEVKELEIKTQQDNLKLRLDGLFGTLYQLTGIPLRPDAELQFPQMESPLNIPALERPEQPLFQSQREAILAQSDMIEARKKPQLNAYAQAGTGYPNPLNILDNNIAPFGLIGLQLNWQITDWKKSQKDKELLSLKAQQVQHSEATFNFNLETQTANYLAEIKRLTALIAQDKNIAELQARILEQSAAQLDEGIITSADYITQLNAELLSRQNLLIHQTELLATQLEFWNERGAF